MTRRFTPAELDDLRTRSAHLINEMRRIVDRDTTVDLRALTHQLRQIGVVYGRPGVAHILHGWLDQVIDVVPGAERGQQAMVAFANASFTGAMPPERVTADYRWVAELLQARLADNQVRVYQLVDQVHPADQTLYLMRALEVTATMLITAEQDGDEPFRPGMYWLAGVGLTPA